LRIISRLDLGCRCMRERSNEDYRSGGGMKRRLKPGGTCSDLFFIPANG
jgi:hypothetical protein